jgi:TatA/E family protein of Tat protein translocase
MSSIGFWEIAVVVVIALLLFGPKKLPDMGRSLGRSITGFRQGLKETQEEVKSTVAEVRDAAGVGEVKAAVTEVREATGVSEIKSTVAEIRNAGSLKDTPSLKTDATGSVSEPAKTDGVDPTS